MALVAHGTAEREPPAMGLEPEHPPALLAVCPIAAAYRVALDPCHGAGSGVVLFPAERDAGAARDAGAQLKFPAAELPSSANGAGANAQGNSHAKPNTPIENDKP